MELFLFLLLNLGIPFIEVDGRNHDQAEMQYSPTRSYDIKRIQYTIDKDFDCIDIYKQPAFQHPLLKNHKIQLYPTFSRKRLQSTSSYGNASNIHNFTKGCPRGKVPIHNRIKMMHQKNTTSSELQAQDFRQFSQDYPRHHSVTLGTTTPNTIYHGATASIGTYNLSLQLNQYSLSQMWLQSGPPTELNSIQVGAGIHPSLYGDSIPRVTGYWTVDNFQRTGCFNTLCPGFVQADTKCTFGVPLLPSSTIGRRPKYFALFKVRQDESTGHWWLIAYDAGKAVYLGYWPKEIFTHLREGSSLIKYGGETYAPPDMISPPMGSGELPQTLYLNSACIATLKIVDSEYRVLDLPDDVNIFRDTSPSCYDLLYNGDQGDPYGQAFLYGGPGGQCGI